MRKVDGFIERRREIAALYSEKLIAISGIILPEQLEETESGWYLYVIQLDAEVLSKSRKEDF
ncbi:DegT/DnrJ/EryC1/StrS family aminotransferase [Sporosarcina limicola]|uniref:dTDP-4-amino-4,6-dideoxygalactose transaminase n=1 Tax=Sporosarcina limicola TaxID=34101 RepID=A0A927MIT9_9BACL|nr:DegT/DnrJ/EryC1/StrS family aminotransferase [Sporosarcina limicola]MBE1555398.1 dTDP-4-amino-4,6-dideoxygalactose transaminase [Sporosarcina limicola]